MFSASIKNREGKKYRYLVFILSAYILLENGHCEVFELIVDQSKDALKEKYFACLHVHDVHLNPIESLS